MSASANLRTIFEAEPGGRVERLIVIGEAAHVILQEPVQAKCCGAMRAWFVNRDGRTRCYVCDEAESQ